MKLFVHFVFLARLFSFPFSFIPLHAHFLSARGSEGHKKKRRRKGIIIHWVSHPLFTSDAFLPGPVQNWIPNAEIKPGFSLFAIMGRMAGKVRITEVHQSEMGVQPTRTHGKGNKTTMFFIVEVCYRPQSQLGNVLLGHEGCVCVWGGDTKITTNIILNRYWIPRTSHEKSVQSKMQFKKKFSPVYTIFCKNFP